MYTLELSTNIKCLNKRKQDMKFFAILIISWTFQRANNNMKCIELKIRILQIIRNSKDYFSAWRISDMLPSFKSKIMGVFQFFVLQWVKLKVWSFWKYQIQKSEAKFLIIGLILCTVCLFSIFDNNNFNNNWI